jgi:hypothetical protein
MKTIGKSNLLGKSLRFVGFKFDEHPLYLNRFVQISIYNIVDLKDYVICVSEGEGKGDLLLAKSGLGQTVSGEEIVKFASRHLANVEFEILKTSMQKTGGKWHWAK